MTPRQRPIASYPPPQRSREHYCRVDDSPEAILLSLGAEIRRLSGERPFSVELVLREQVFVLLLDGFRLQPLPGGLKGLVPPQPGLLHRPGQEDLPVGLATRTMARGFWLAGQAAPWPQAGAVDQTVAALLQAGMGWVQVDGQAAALCFPSPPQAASLNTSLPVDSAEASGCGDRLPRAGAEAHPCRPSGDRWL